ncbi:hypothetical protein BC829DRAFT_448794 [Chytridium lagenaria]|nr:hypothetical protein BC829DRAFT_448794 [Chytridium lagenaria]
MAGSEVDVCAVTPDVRGKKRQLMAQREFEVRFKKRQKRVKFEDEDEMKWMLRMMDIIWRIESVSEKMEYLGIWIIETLAEAPASSEPWLPGSGMPSEVAKFHSIMKHETTVLLDAVKGKNFDPKTYAGKPSPLANHLVEKYEKLPVASAGSSNLSSPAPPVLPNVPTNMTSSLTPPSFGS